MTDLQKVANWMFEHSYATGHGDTIEDLLKELEWQIEASKKKAYCHGLENGIEAERKACAVLCENMERNGAWITKAEAAAAIRARDIDAAAVGEVGIWGEKPWVKTYCGGKPNYTTPVDAVNMKQEHVDETAKGEHIKCIVKDCENHIGEGTFIGNLCKPCHDFLSTGEGVYSQAYRNTKREWVGLTDEEIYDYADKFLYQHGSNYGIRSFGKAVEAKLKEKNG